METVTLKKEDLLRAWADGCQATKKALEDLYPEILFRFLNGLILLPIHAQPEWPIGFPGPYLCVDTNQGKFLAALDHRGWNFFEDLKKRLRPMRSGTIIITVKDGLISKAKVEED